MSGPLDEDAAPRKAPANQPPGQDYVEAEVSGGSDLDRQAETRRRWVEANRDRIRELNRRWRAEHLERARQLNRDSMRRATSRRRREAEVRAQGRERAKRWREAHPDRVREYQRRWVDGNREKVREYYNRYYANHRDDVNARAAARRDADPERTRQASKQWAERNKERRAESQRNRRSHPEAYQKELDANAAARRLKRTRERAGLPPKQLHPVTATERRANEREADAYFGDPALPEHLRQFTVFAESLTEHLLKNGARMREFAQSYVATRARMGLPRVRLEDIMYARAVELITDQMRRVDLLTSRDIAAAVRSTKAAVQQEERKQRIERLVRLVVAHTHRNLNRLSEEASMENVAMSRLGKPRVSVDSLLVRLAMEEVFERVPTSRLTFADARTAADLAKLRIVLPIAAHPSANDDRALRRSIY
jgi:hypothetical protein